MGWIVGACKHRGVTTSGNGLQEAIDRLQANDLMPPVKAIESGAGGWIRVTVIGAVDGELRARLTAAMGSTRWKLTEAQNEIDAGAEYRSSGRLC
ncbi:hypothetical protein [uncultured Jatrophihabitans sp.]|uniref:hypothetical protein n=1 Tax=uncultured Jatrophihabitans sp. TaxID=1610747 RepID=UPI0035CBF28F